MDVIRLWFDSTSGFDTQFHCDNAMHGHCSRRVCKLPNGKLLAVCNNDSTGCPDLPIALDDIRLHTINLQKIATSISDLTAESFICADI